VAWKHDEIVPSENLHLLTHPIQLNVFPTEGTSSHPK
jgi:hypothetical protein